MASFVTEFKHLEIQLEEIILATNNFDESKVIGGGGFGKVYAGELSHSQSQEKSLVAIKRLDRKYGQGDPEFFKEIRMLSCYRHENLISLLGFCCQGGEMILIYEYASRGSLDRYLSSSDLTWIQRLRICIDAAKGLSFLHDPNGTQQRVLHCDIKSANILLDKNMTAKVSDFGLSKMGPANQQYSLLITSAVGTPGYCDPLYMQTYSLTKESDVYSFGVVLFEVLFGRLCAEISNDKLMVYVPFWKQIFKEKRLDEIIFPDLIPQMGPGSLETYANIAYQCLKKSRKERPTMSLVVEKLENSLEFQMFHDLQLPKEYQVIIEAAVPPLKCRSLEELKELLSKGFYVNNGKTWLSINSKGERIVMVSIEDYLTLDDLNRDYSDPSSFEEKSRFKVGFYKTCLMEFKLHVRTPLFLSPDVTYGLNLVFHYSEIENVKQQHVGIQYKLQGEKTISIVHFADMNENKRLVAELYQFTSNEESILDLEIFLEDCGLSGDFYIEGIEFRPLEKVESQVIIANQEIVRGVVPPLFYRSTEVLKVLLSQGVLLNQGKTLLTITEKGEHIERIYIEACLDPAEYNVLTHPSDDIVNSRFPEGQCYEYDSKFKVRVRGQYLTPQTGYTLKLVFRYKWEQNFNSYNPLRYKIDGEDETKVFIIYPTDMRQDGWFIVPLYHFTSQHTTADLQVEFESRGTTILLVAGIKFQPSEETVELEVFEEYQDIVKVASQPLFYTSLDELKQILSNGVHLNGYKTWFSLNEKGEHCHMISMKDCLIPNEDSTPQYVSNHKSRFPEGLYQTNKKGFKTHVKAELLSPNITYTVNLVCCSSSEGELVYVDFKYRLRGETTTSTVYLANQRKDAGFYMAELYQFTSDGSIVDLEIIFENSGSNIRGVEGIMFQPLEIVEDPMLEDDKLSSDTEKWTMKKNLYSSLGKWFQFNNDTAQEWSYLDKNEKKCIMLSARASGLIMQQGHYTWCSLPESRFGEVLVITDGSRFELVNTIKPEVLSDDTTYASYFVYKLPSDQKYTFEHPLEVNIYMSNYYQRYRFSYLVSPPNTPVIGKKFDENNYNPLNRHKLSALPRRRSDGLMEVKVWQFRTRVKSTVSMKLRLKQRVQKDLSGLIIHGIELRPI